MVRSLDIRLRRYAPPPPAGDKTEGWRKLDPRSGREWQIRLPRHLRDGSQWR